MAPPAGPAAPAPPPGPPAPGRRRPRSPLASARTRVLVAFVALLAFAALVSTLLLRQVLLERTGERVDAELTQEVDEFRRLVRIGRNPETGRPFGTDVAAMFDVFLQRNVPSEGEGIFTFLPRGIQGSRVDSDLPPEVLDRVLALQGTTASTRGEIAVGDTALRYVAVPIVLEGARRGVFVVTKDLRGEEDEVGEAVQVAAGVSILALLLSALLGSIVTGRVLAPLREVTATARSITESDLTRRIPVEGRDEIAQLGRTFNAMLDRLEVAFASQRALVSDAGHELRTPITIIRGHLELMSDDPQERAETLALVDDELERMARMVDDLLTLAKAERTDFLRPEVLDADELTPELFAKAQALDPGREWRLGPVGTGTLVGDRQRLTQAVVNLAANAARHATPGTPVELSSTVAGGEVRFAVRDEGPGIPPGEQERIFERFVRGAGGRRSEGSGLGLAIVRAIAEAHGGRVELRSSVEPPARGSTFTLVIPVDPSPQEVPTP